jgi:enoyl-CoA hydratase
LDEISNALDRAANEAKAVVFTGRPGCFSAGFDLSVMKSGNEGLRKLVKKGGELMLKAYLHPQPLVVACTGHAVAGGALLLLVGDSKLGIDGNFKIGLNEVAIGLRLPVFAYGLAQMGLSKRHLTRATLLSEFYDPIGAIDCGYLDRVCAPEALRETALGEAKRLAQYPSEVFIAAKNLARGEFVEKTLSRHDKDCSNMVIPSS